jgi:hypothetical protein
MYLVLFLTGIILLQLIIPGIVLLFTPKQLSPELPAPEPTEAEKRQQRISRAAKEFLPDGTVHLRSWSSTVVNGEYKSEYQIWDVNDNLLWSGPDKELPNEYLSWPMRKTGYREDVTNQMLLPFFSKILMVPVKPSEMETTGYWRYERGNRYFVGFDAKGRKIGYAGSNGIKQFRNQVEPFGQVKYVSAWCPQDSYSPVLLWQTRYRLYKIDFQSRNVEVVFDAQDKEIDKIFMYNWHRIESYYGTDANYSEYRPAIRLDTKSGDHHLWLRDPNEHLMFSMPTDWDPEGASVAATKDKIFLRYHGEEGPPRPKYFLLWDEWEKKYRSKPFQKWVELYEIERAGSLKLINRFEWTSTPRQALQSGQDPRDRYRRARYYVKTISSPLLDLASHWHYKKMLYSDRRNEFEFADFIVLSIGKGDFYQTTNRTVNLAVSLLMVCLAFWHGCARRTSWAKFVFWLVFVGAFNLAGLLTYLALMHTAVIRCHACGRRRGLERVDCVWCGNELPQPERRKLDLVFNN